MLDSTSDSTATRIDPQALTNCILVNCSINKKLPNKQIATLPTDKCQPPINLNKEDRCVKKRIQQDNRFKARLPPQLNLPTTQAYLFFFITTW